MIRSGLGVQVASELAELKSSLIPGQFLAKVANLAWRVNRAQLGLRLIYPALGRSAELRVADPELFAEFAACLLEVGAMAESKLMLAKVASNYPRAQFYRALLCFKEWDYESACPILESYLHTLEPSYHRFVVEVNLASALVFTRQYERAKKLLQELKPQLQKNELTLLYGNCLEIESQIHFHLSQHQAALDVLDQASNLLSKTRNMGWLYSEKWKFLNRMALEPNNSSKFFDQYVDLKQLASEMASWETVRELDLHWALHFKDYTRLTHVYFGSPFKNYRQQVKQKAAAIDFDLEKVPSYDFQNADSVVIVSDANMRSIEELVLLDGESLHNWLPKKLLLVLLSDFYAPFRTGQLFSKLFDGQHYDPESSPDKVFQAVARLREQGRKNSMFDVIKTNEGYRLKLNNLQGIRLPQFLLSDLILERDSLYGEILRTTYRDKLFTSSDVSQRFGGSVRTANRILKSLTATQQVKTVGRGRAVRYKLAG